MCVCNRVYIKKKHRFLPGFLYPQTTSFRRDNNISDIRARPNNNHARCQTFECARKRVAVFLLEEILSPLKLSRHAVSSVLVLRSHRRALVRDDNRIMRRVDSSDDIAPSRAYIRPVRIQSVCRTRSNGASLVPRQLLSRTSVRGHTRTAERPKTIHHETKRIMMIL